MFLGGWMGGWVGGCKSRFKDCLQQSKKAIIMVLFEKYSNRFNDCFIKMNVN
jgi:hypothetical protein